MLQTKLILLALVLGLLGGAFWYVDRNAREQATQELTEVYNKKLKDSQEKSKVTEEALEAEIESTKKERNERVTELHSTIKRLRDELRNRPQRPADNSQNPENRNSCTGAELFREDAEFLAGEAARADRILIERNFYYESYMSVYNELEKLRNAQK